MTTKRSNRERERKREQKYKEKREVDNKQTKKRPNIEIANDDDETHKKKESFVQMSTYMCEEETVVLTLDQIVLIIVRAQRMMTAMMRTITAQRRQLRIIRTLDSLSSFLNLAH